EAVALQVAEHVVALALRLDGDVAARPPAPPGEAVDDRRARPGGGEGVELLHHPLLPLTPTGDRARSHGAGIDVEILAEVAVVHEFLSEREAAARRPGGALMPSAPGPPSLQAYCGTVSAPGAQEKTRLPGPSQKAGCVPV